MNNEIVVLNKKYLYDLRVILIIFFLGFTIIGSSQCVFDIVLSKTDNGCNQTLNGSVNVVVIGSSNVESKWKDSFGNEFLLTDSLMTSLPSGSYIVFTTDTIANCTQYKTVVINSYIETGLNIQNVSCPTCEDGLAELYFEGGIDPYLFQWDDEYSQNTRIASDLIEGLYVVSLTDSSNCIVDNNVEILDCGKNLKVDFTINTETCIGCNDASILANVTGGVVQSYLWDDPLNQTTALASNLNRHLDYSLVVTDTAGCQNTFFVDSTDFCKASILPSFSLITEASCYTCTNGVLKVSTVGTHPNFQYNWQINGSNSDTLQNELPGKYKVKITDTIGCSINFEVDYQYCFGTLVLNNDFVFVSNEYLVSSSVATNDSYDTAMFVSYSVAQKPKLGIVKMNFDGLFTYRPFKNFSGIDSFTYKVLSDCGFSKEIKAYLIFSNNDMVWPGDVNLNGVVDNFDLLPLAVYYDSIGPLRVGANDNYYGQLATNWASSQFNSINIKHADCNGSGKIDTADLSLIIKNYGVIHSNDTDTIQGDIPFKIIAPDSIKAGDTVVFKIVLGDSAFNANDVYGLAYTFNINKDVVNSNYVEVEFNNSWFTPDTNRLSFFKSFLEKGRIDIAQSRKNMQNATGQGEIGSIIIVIEEDLDDIKEQDIISLTSVRLIKNDETHKYVNKRIETVTSIKKFGLQNDFELIISPNPSNGKLNVVLPKKGDYEIDLVNVLGQVIYSKSFKNERNINLNIENRKGLFLLKVRSKNLESIQKLVIY